MISCWGIIVICFCSIAFVVQNNYFCQASLVGEGSTQGGNDVEEVDQRMAGNSLKSFSTSFTVPPRPGALLGLRLFIILSSSYGVIVGIPVRLVRWSFQFFRFSVLTAVCVVKLLVKF